MATEEELNAQANEIMRESLSAQAAHVIRTKQMIFHQARFLFIASTIVSLTYGCLTLIPLIEGRPFDLSILVGLLIAVLLIGTTRSKYLAARASLPK